jgi:uncharacterized protein YdiU (UPF0061 family)
MRETKLPGAVLTRVASSHIRIGTFEFFASRGDLGSVRRLADYAIARHYPEAARAPNPYRALLEGVVARQADLIARWQLVGFIHGVMNTDNMSVAGETIDYGPCAFMDAYDPATVFSSIDYGGRYAFSNQPDIAQFNLACLAICLIPLLADEERKGREKAKEVLASFAGRFDSTYVDGLRRKLGFSAQKDGDKALAQDLLDRMAAGRADFTLTFRRLCDAAESQEADASVRALFDAPASFDEWAARWRRRIGQESKDGTARRAEMRRVNPAFIPRNHRVEWTIEAAVARKDFAPFHELIAVLSAPFEDKSEFARFAEPPPPDQRVYQTFCGT